MKHFKRVAAVVAAIGAVLGLTVPTATAAPAPGYEAFAGCPNDPSVFVCLRSDTEAGSIQIGKTTTPITETITLSGGISGTSVISTPEGGLIADPMNVPGGLSGLTGLSEFLINLLTFGAHQVYAQPILVGTPTLGPLGAVLTLSLPIRVKLINPFLTSTCSIGSAGNPITLNLTTGTTSPPPPNMPISGVIHPFMPTSTPGVSEALDLKLVDNAFSAPAASGCTLFGFGLLNPLVNARVGLPAAAGTNTAIQDDTRLRLALKTFVYP